MRLRRLDGRRLCQNKNAEYFFLYGAVIHNRCTDTYPKQRKIALLSDRRRIDSTSQTFFPCVSINLYVIKNVLVEERASTGYSFYSQLA